MTEGLDLHLGVDKAAGSVGRALEYEDLDYAEPAVRRMSTRGRN